MANQLLKDTPSFSFIGETLANNTTSEVPTNDIQSTSVGNDQQSISSSLFSNKDPQFDGQTSSSNLTMQPDHHHITLLNHFQFNLRGLLDITDNMKTIYEQHINCHTCLKNNETHPFIYNREVNQQQQPQQYLDTPAISPQISQKKERIPYTYEENKKLSMYFQSNRYPTRREYDIIANATNITRKRIVQFFRKERRVENMLYHQQYNKSLQTQQNSPQ